MKLMPLSLLSSRCIYIALINVTLFTACASSQKDEFKKESYFGGIILAQIPNNWHPIPWPTKLIRYPKDTTTLALVGLSENYGMLMQLKYRQQMDIQSLSTNELLDIYSSSRSSAKILSVKTDSIKNCMDVDFTGWYDSSKKIHYFKHLLFVQNRKWVTIEFHGPNSQAFRDTVKQVAARIKINSQ